MYAAGTVSSQTVCQMPVTAVYQMLFGSSTCLPRGCVPASVGSVTRDDELLVARRLQGVGDVERERIVAAGVAADTLAVDVDLRFPVDRAEVQQQPRPARERWRAERAPVPEALRVADRARRRRSTATGWQTARGCARRTSAARARPHRARRSPTAPFRFCHARRTICGRGYSGSARAGVTSAAHWVRSFVAAGCADAEVNAPLASEDENRRRQARGGRNHEWIMPADCKRKRKRPRGVPRGRGRQFEAPELPPSGGRTTAGPCAGLPAPGPSSCRRGPGSG